MGAAALANFKKGFDSSGIIWIWGCSFARAYNIILSTIFKTRKFKKTPPGKLKDTDIFKLEFVEDTSKRDGTLQFNFIKDNLTGGTLKAGPPRSYTITKNFSDIKQFFKDHLKNTYSAIIAANAGVITFGALLGTYADFERIPKSSFPLMLIPRKVPPYADNFTRSIDFYKRYV